MENNKKLCDYEVITDNDYREEDKKFYNQLVALKEEINKILIEKRCTGLEKEYQQIRDEAAEVIKKAEAGLPDKMSPAEITKTISELECSIIELSELVEKLKQAAPEGNEKRDAVIAAHRRLKREMVELLGRLKEAAKPRPEAATTAGADKNIGESIAKTMANATLNVKMQESISKFPFPFP